MTADVLAHLALVLSAADLARRIQGRDDDPGALLGPTLRLAARAVGARRASLFLVSGASADDAADPMVLRVARTGSVVVPEVAMFVPRASQPVFACFAGETPSFEGPVRADDPFYREHQAIEPEVPPEVAWVPVVVHGVPRAAIELSRDTPFGEGDGAALADLGLATARALELASTVLSATRRAFVREGGGGS